MCLSSLSSVMRDGQWSVTSKLHSFTCGCSTHPMPCSRDPVRAAVQWHCWKKPFHPHTPVPWKSPLSLLKPGFVSLASVLQSSLTRTVPEETKQTKLLYIVALSLSPAGTRGKYLWSQEQRRKRMKNIWPAESTTTAAEPSPVHSTVRSSCETQDSASAFPEILWRGSDPCRWDRGISQRKSVVLEAAIFKRWAKYLEI